VLLLGMLIVFYCMLPVRGKKEGGEWNNEFFVCAFVRPSVRPSVCVAGNTGGDGGVGGSEEGAARQALQEP
jgi:hypothetical protein